MGCNANTGFTCALLPFYHWLQHFYIFWTPPIKVKVFVLKYWFFLRIHPCTFALAFLFLFYCMVLIFKWKPFRWWKLKVQLTSNGNVTELANVHTIREPDRASQGSPFVYTRLASLEENWWTSAALSPLTDVLVSLCTFLIDSCAEHSVPVI